MAKKFYLGHKIGVNPRSQSVRALHAQSKNLLFFSRDDVLSYHHNYYIPPSLVSLAHNAMIIVQCVTMSIWHGRRSQDERLDYLTCVHSNPFATLLSQVFCSTEVPSTDEATQLSLTRCCRRQFLMVSQTFAVLDLEQSASSFKNIAVK